MKVELLTQFLVLLGGILGFVLGLILGMRPNVFPKSRYLGFALATHALTDVFMWLFWANDVVDLRLIRLLPLNVVLLPVSCLFQYVQGFTGAKPRLRNYTFWLVAAASVELAAYLLPAGAALYEQGLTWPVLEFAKSVRMALSILILPAFCFAAYYMWQMIEAYRQHLPDEPARRYGARWLTQLLAGSCVLYGLALLALLLPLVLGWHSRAFVYPLCLASGAFLLYSGVRAFAVHDWVRDGLAAASTQQASADAGEQEVVDWSSQDALFQQAIQLIEQEQLYRLPNLKLVDVAERLSISPHYLSRVVNQRAQRSFTDLINEYRVEEVKRLMHDPAFARYTLESLGLEAGFGAKSTYQTAFKRVTGLTPSQYRSHGRPVS